MLPIPVRAVILILLLSFLCPAFAAAGIDPGCCEPSNGNPETQGIGFAGGTCLPAQDSGCPEGGADTEACSCESCQPFFAPDSDTLARVLAGKERVQTSDPLDPSAAFPSEVFHPPLS